MAPRFAITLVVAGLVLAVIGCGDDGFGQSRYKVSGKVNYNGSPIEKGEISFVPQGGEGRAATGTIKNGYYTLTTLTEGDGAVPGKYMVTVSSRNVDLTAAQEKVKGLAPGAALPQDYVAKAIKDAKSNIPAKYGLAETTPLKDYEVKAQSNTFNFELTD
jgi:hypothetical protein